jgi:O-antigen/teichoic acid export membrane protein
LRHNVREALASAWAIGTRASGSALQFAVNVLVGRLVGPAGTGLYFLYVSWTNLLATIATLGYPLYCLRTVAALEASGAQAHGRALVRRSILLVGVVGAGLGVAFAIAARPVASLVLGDVAHAWVLRLAGGAAAGMAVLRVLAEALKARGRVGQGFAIEFNAAPAFLTVVLLVALVVGLRITPLAVLGVHTAVLVALPIPVAIALLRSWGAKAGTGVAPAVRRRELVALWGITLLNNALAAAPYVLLPHLAAPDDIGRFGVAHRLVAFSATIMVALGGYFGPLFARHAAAGDADAVRRAYRRSQWYSLAAYAPFLLVFVGLPGLVLDLFGPGFAQGRWILVVLAAGRLVNAAGGIAGYLLNMTGGATAELASATTTLTVFVGLAIPLGGRLGVMGVAWAYATAFALGSVLSVALALRRLRYLDASRPAATGVVAVEAVG